MISVHPPSTSPPRYSIAFGMHSHAEGSCVPGQANSNSNFSCTSPSCEAPWLIFRGCIRCLRSSRMCRKADPLGEHSHLWQLPVQYAGASTDRSSGTIPGPCAASSSTSTPLDCSRAVSSSNGILIPVGLVTVSIKARTVLSVTAPMMMSITSCGPSTLNGISTTTVFAPDLSVTKSTAFQQA